MFWLSFAVLIAFIVFLIVILFASQSSTNRNLEHLKDEVAEKKKSKQPTATKAKAKPKRVKPKKVVEPTPEPEPVAVVVEEVASVVEVPPVSVEPEPIPVEVETAPEEPVVIPAPEPEVVEVVEEVITPEVEVAIEEPEHIKVEEVAEDESYDYPPFDHSRTMEEFGLDADEAAEFIQELIKQVDEAIPDLEAAVSAMDETKIEDISHMIKGSATNLGTGGMADVLIDFNTYVKEAHDPAVIAQHMRNLHRAQKDLKAQFA